jgi:hypothetical protein
VSALVARRQDEEVPSDNGKTWSVEGCLSEVACTLAVMEQATVEHTDSRHEFDFIFGDWDIHNRKRRNSADPTCEEWVEFETTSRTEPVFGGLSHLERITAGPEAPGGAWEGLTLRQLDPADGRWRIWWASSRRPGHVDPPLVGGFTDGVGVFTGADTLAGTPIELRFTWTNPEPDRARWTQELSWDGGASWRLDWVMDFRRSAARG